MSNPSGMPRSNKLFLVGLLGGMILAGLMGGIYGGYVSTQADTPPGSGLAIGFFAPIGWAEIYLLVAFLVVATRKLKRRLWR